jgi:excisionase family DNA binding protein
MLGKNNIAAGPVSAEVAPDTNSLSVTLSRILVALDEIRGTLAQRSKEWYTVEELADVTGRSGYTVRRWIAEGRVKATRITGTGPRGRLLISRDQLAGLVEGGLGSRMPNVMLSEDRVPGIQP